MKRYKKALVIIGAIVICAVLGIWYINKFFLPIKAKDFVIDLVREKTPYNIVIGRMNYFPLTRFYLKDVALYDESAPERPFIKIEGLSLGFQLLPLIKERMLAVRVGLTGLVYGKVKLNGVSSISLKRRILPASRPFLKNIDGTVEFINFAFATPLLPSSVENMDGRISLQDNTLFLEKVFFKYNNRVYEIEGVLGDLDKEEPAGTFSLNSDILVGEGDLAFKDDYMQIKKINGALYGRPFSIIGDVKDLSSPYLNLYCESKVDLSDLKKIFPKSKYVSDSLRPAGLCDGAIFFAGKLENPKVSEASIKLSSNKIFLHGLALDNLYLDIRLENGFVTTPRFSIRPYLGFLTGTFDIDLNDATLPYTLSLALKDANLAKFSGDMNFGKEDMAGLMSGKSFLKGSLKSRDALSGSGWVTVVDGRLWEVPLLSGVANLLNIPHLRSVVFKEAAGNFVIAERRLSTENLTFYSDRVNMSVAGSADFDGNLNFLLTTHITQDLIEGSSEAASIANLLISQAGNYMGEVEITGTLKKPQYRFASKPIEDIFKKELKGLLKDIIR